MRKPVVVLLIIMLSASIGLKVAMGPVKRSPDLPDTLRQLDRLAVSSGYAHDGAVTEIAAPNLALRHNRCRLRLFALDPDTGLAARMRSIRRPHEVMLFHVGARTTADAPRLRPTLANYAQSYLLAMGVDLPATPVIGELRSGDCGDAPPIDFGRLRTRLIRD